MTHTDAAALQWPADGTIDSRDSVSSKAQNMADDHNRPFHVFEVNGSYYTKAAGTEYGAERKQIILTFHPYA